MAGPINSILHSKYEGETRIHKHKLILKLAYDVLFYLFITVLSYLLFVNEYWFPSMVGGCGSCSNLYKDYPNWPEGSADKLEMYFLIQLGIHVFSVFEMIVIKRKT